MANGTVLFYAPSKTHADRYFGFLVDDAIGTDDRETNAYFDERALHGFSAAFKGMRVRFEYDLESDRPRAKKVSPIQ
jgi:hypothetical protein